MSIFGMCGLAVAALIALGALSSIGDIGKPRKPTEARSTAAAVVVSAAMCVWIVAAALRS